MSIEPHILDDEKVENYCFTKDWVWVCTDRRLLKYRQSDSGRESLSDVSYSQISGISLTQKPKNQKLLTLSIASGAGAIWGVITDATGSLLISLFLLMLAVGFAWLWKKSDDDYFELKGSGPIRQEPEKWRIKSDTESPDEVRQFVKTLRGQL
jgi:hypothetical protein